MKKTKVASNNAVPSVKLDKLSKRYPGVDRFSLKNVSLQLYPGEVYGFLGPNGAGKSTAIRTLMGFIKPTSGSATINGFDIDTQSLQVRQSVGFLSGDLALYPKMTGRQYISYLSELQGSCDKQYIQTLAKRLQASLDRPLGELSRGNRQKIGIIQAFMHKPSILILDEPTSGLDPLVQETFFELIREAKQRQATIFMSSHVLSEVQKICDKVGIIREGELIAEKNISEMANDATQTFDIVFIEKAPLASLKKINGLKIVSHNDKQIRVHINGKLSNLFAVLAKHEVRSIDAHNLDLEEAFIHFYKKGGR